MIPALLLALVQIFGLSAANSEGHPTAFEWKIVTPQQSVIECYSVECPIGLIEDGAYSIDLYAIYLHQGPMGPLPWISHATASYSTVIFADGFESGNTNAWN